ncbi:MAG: hypothetical protein AB1630_03795 [bacterium]
MKEKIGAILFLIVGLGCLLVAIAKFIKEGFDLFFLVSFSFGIVFTIGAFNVLLKKEDPFFAGKLSGVIVVVVIILLFLGVGIMTKIPLSMLLLMIIFFSVWGSGILFSLFKKPKSPFLKEEVVIPERPTFIKIIKELEDAYTSLFLLLSFSLLPLCYGGGGFIFGLIVAFIIPPICIEYWKNLEKEERKKKSPIPYEIREKMKEYFALTGYAASYILLIAGSIITLIKYKYKSIPGTTILWGLITLWGLRAFHKTINEKYSFAEKFPFIFQFTEVTVGIFQVFSIPLKVLSIPLTFLRRKPDEINEISIPVSLPLLSIGEARSLANEYAVKKYPLAYIFAIYSGGESGVSKDGQAEEWRCFYYQPEKDKQVEWVVTKDKVRAKRTEAFYGKTPPERLLDDWLDCSKIIKIAQEGLSQIMTIEEESPLYFYVYLPASQFPEEMGNDLLSSAKICWVISVFDEDMTFIQNFYVNVETHELISPEFIKEMEI